ncbi:GNAT family N-acetyltransferase [Mycetocola sp. JXN-3]|uniref:GNAT family N-acetyltransferase n=1 Tax=Mycetocola sp. JXN-3 TaxID=2116510 RepID=UPI00165CFDF1|nr:GNAT family N-acetyltransferase [Mycetocola sp. JXN-3]
MTVSSFTIRELIDTDLDAAIALLSLASASDNRDRLRERLAQNSPAPVRIALVAEADGVMIAAAKITSENATPGAASALVVVDPAHRFRGIGTALYRRLMSDLATHPAGATITLTSALRDDAAPGRGFAEARGFELVRHNLGWSLELEGRAAELLAEAESITTANAATVRVASIDTEYPLIAAVMARCAIGLPGPIAGQPVDTTGFEHHFARTAVYLVASVDGAPAGLGVIHPVGEEGEWYTDFTGVDPDYRQRGIARLLKAAELAEAAGRAGRRMGTHNDAHNTGIVRVNVATGMDPALGYWSLVNKNPRKTAVSGA